MVKVSGDNGGGERAALQNPFPVMFYGFVFWANLFDDLFLDSFPWC